MPFWATAHKNKKAADDGSPRALTQTYPSVAVTKRRPSYSYFGTCAGRVEVPVPVHAGGREERRRERLMDVLTLTFSLRPSLASHRRPAADARRRVAALW